MGRYTHELDREKVYLKQFRQSYDQSTVGPGIVDRYTLSDFREIIISLEKILASVYDGFHSHEASIFMPEPDGAMREFTKKDTVTLFNKMSGYYDDNAIDEDYHFHYKADIGEIFVHGADVRRSMDTNCMYGLAGIICVGALAAVRYIPGVPDELLLAIPVIGGYAAVHGFGIRRKRDVETSGMTIEIAPNPMAASMRQAIKHEIICQQLEKYDPRKPERTWAVVENLDKMVDGYLRKVEGDR